MIDFFSRLDSYLNYKGLNDNKLTVETGISNGLIGKARKRGSLSQDNISKILHKYSELDANWLLTGSGEMLKSGIPIAISAENPTEGIPLIPVDAMAGYGAGESQVMEFESERFVVPTFRGADFLIQVKGSSMYPKYNSGDIVACKKLFMDDLFFQWNKVYVLDTEQGALIKRIDQGADPDHVMIVSDNEKYRPFALHKSKINAISIVMGVIRLE